MRMLTDIAASVAMRWTTGPHSGLGVHGAGSDTSVEAAGTGLSSYEVAVLSMTQAR